MAAHTGISKSTVARYFARFGLQPHRSKSFKLSTDPFFVGKVRDIVGLYLNPGEMQSTTGWMKNWGRRTVRSGPKAPPRCRLR